jgi:uncharacterized protein
MVERSSADLLAASLHSDDGPIERLDTHVSSLVFQGGWVYKVKKPVHFEFIDLSTPERREAICHREVELNRRFAHDVYEGVVEVRDPNDVVVDHAVKMRRMPVERRLSTLLASADAHDMALAESALRSVARQMAVAHAAAPRSSIIDAVATPEALAYLWRRSTDDMRTYVPGIFDAEALDEIDDGVGTYLNGRHALLADRVARRMIVDGHGDLMADDIFCLEDGPRILDCLEFDDQLRYGDVLLDIGFLAMDVERLGRPDLARRFVEWYDEFSAEHHPASLLHHLIAYRALVRSKIAAIRSADSPEAASQARSLLELCRSHVRSSEVLLVIVGGLPATGKSTVAAALGESFDWTTLVADRVRKELTGVGLNPAPAPFGQGIYSPAWTAATYAELFERATVSLQHGESVVIDASFIDARRRRQAREVAWSTSSRLVELRCDADAELCEKRLRERPHDREHLSDADAQIAARMAETGDAWPEAFVVDTAGPVEHSLAVARGVCLGTN